MHGRVARPDARHRAHGQGGRRLAVPRRRLQAAHLALRVPGPRSRGPAAARRGQGRDRAADRHRVHGRARPRGRARGGRRHPDRRPQHAELPAAGRDRPLRAPGAAQARRVGDARGAADGGRVHPQGGQPERAAVRARHPHVRDRLPLHARPHRGAGAQGAHAPARDRRPEPRGRAAQPRDAAVAGRGRRGRGRDHRRGAPRARARDLRRPAGARRRRLRRLRRAGRARRRRRRQGALGSTCVRRLERRARIDVHRIARPSAPIRSSAAAVTAEPCPRRRPGRRVRGLAARDRPAEVRGYDPAPGVLDRALEHGAISTACGSPAEALAGADAAFVAAPVRALPGVVGEALAAAGPRVRGDRRRLDQARAGRRRSTTTASSAATRWRAPRPRASSTRAPGCSTAPPGT